LKYKAARDIPKAARELRTLSPTKISEWVRRNRTKEDARGKRQQHEVTPQSITMFFMRNPKIAAILEAEITTAEVSRHAITEDLFENGAFRKIPCIAKWIGKLTAREAKPATINRMLSNVKYVCQGILPKDEKGERRIIEGWGLIHPRDLTLDESIAYLVALREVTTHTRRFRIALRNFLKSRGVKDWDDISGKAEAEEGKYSHLYVEKERIEMIFYKLDQINHEVYLASKFAFKTATRLTAMLNAHAKYFFEVGGQNFLFVFEKASRGKPKRKIKKFIPQALKDELRTQGKLFDVDERTLNTTLRQVFKEVIPEIEKELKMPFHFWRHMFAQHMLRATGWNTSKVAKMGGWGTEALERYYGKMEDKIAFDNAEQLISAI